jgi:hypothetical protein
MRSLGINVGRSINAKELVPRGKLEMEGEENYSDCEGWY